MAECGERSAGRDFALGSSGRRVLEDARAEKRRGDPDGSQERNGGELRCHRRRPNDWRCIAHVVLAGRKVRDGALVLRLRGIGMQRAVQLRERSGRRREKERRHTAEREQRVPDVERSRSARRTHPRGHFLRAKQSAMLIAARSRLSRTDAKSNSAVTF